MLKDLVMRNRSYRRFHQDAPVSRETLCELVDLARNVASASNRQPLRYILSSEAAANAHIFSTLAWAGFLKDWDGPVEGEQPAAYVVVLQDRAISQSAVVDAGIALQTMLLAAAERGLGGCIIGSVQKDRLRELIAVPDGYDILYVLALGRPKETVVLEPVGADGDTRYWRDSDQVHHVPKRSLDEVILAEL